jgi:hypothetical protein
MPMRSTSATLVINALHVFARGHFLKAVGIGIDQRIREIDLSVKIRVGPLGLDSIDSCARMLVAIRRHAEMRG